MKMINEMHKPLQIIYIHYKSDFPMKFYLWSFIDIKFIFLPLLEIMSGDGSAALLRLHAAVLGFIRVTLEAENTARTRGVRPHRAGDGFHLHVYIWISGW